MTDGLIQDASTHACRGIEKNRVTFGFSSWHALEGALQVGTANLDAKAANRRGLQSREKLGI